MEAMFHYTVIKWATDKMEIFKDILKTLLILMGEDLINFLYAGIHMYAAIGIDLLGIISRFQEQNAAPYPMTFHQIREKIMALIQLTQQLHFNPTTISMNYISMNDFWSYDPLTSEAYEVWRMHTPEIQFDVFIGPVLDILRKWSSIKGIARTHTALLRETANIRFTQSWTYIPQHIRVHMWTVFPEVDFIEDVQELDNIEVD